MNVKVILMLLSCCAFTFGQSTLCDSAASFSGPVTITTGGTYTGNWQSASPKIPAVTIATNAPVTIVNSRLRGSGDLLSAAWNNNVTVTNSCFVGTNPNVSGTGKGSPIRIQNPTRVVIEHNDFESTGGNGVYVVEYWGNFTAANSITIRYNRFHNVDGRFSDGAGKYVSTVNGTYSHAVILALVRHVPGIEIAWNQIINDPNNSQVTDSINIFSSSGTPASPILVHDNYVQGQYAANAQNPDGLAYSGTGIVTDDQFAGPDPASVTSWVKIYSNQVVSCGLAGVFISAGHDNEAYGNRVVSSGQLPDGSIISSINAAGVGTNNYLGEAPGVYGNNSVHDNFSGVRRMYHGSWQRQDFYFGAQPAVARNNTSFAPTSSNSPTVADEQNERVLWNSKVTVNGLLIGSSLLPGLPPVGKN